MKRTNVVILGVGALFLLFMVAGSRSSDAHRTAVVSGPEGGTTHYRVEPRSVFRKGDLANETEAGAAKREGHDLRVVQPKQGGQPQDAQVAEPDDESDPDEPAFLRG